MSAEPLKENLGAREAQVRPDDVDEALIWIIGERHHQRVREEMAAYLNDKMAMRALAAHSAAPSEREALLEKLADMWIRTGQLGEGLRTDEYVTSHRQAIMGIYEHCGKTLKDYLAYEARAAAPSEREPETRPFERVLQLHVDSSESMRETFRRTANSDMENWQEGFTEGVKRAIEVYGNWCAALSQDKPTVPK